MITLSSLCLLILLGLFFLLWQSASRAKDYARLLAKRICEQNQLQLLDDTVELEKWRLKRGHFGKLSIYRVYRFYYYNGQVRLDGWISLMHEEMIDFKLSEPTENDSLFTSANESSNVIQFPKKK